MHRLMQGRTCIVIAHRLPTVRILVFDRACVAEEGSHTDLMRHAGLYRDLFTHQAAGLLDV